MTEENKETIEQILRDIRAEVKGTKDEKKFRLPFSSKVSKAKAKKGWVTYLILNDNMNAEFKRFKIRDQTTLVDGIPRLARPHEVFFYKGKPLIIQPSWSVKPFNAEENLQKTIDEKQGTQGYRLLINRMETEAIKDKKTFSFGWLFVILAVLGAGLYFAYKAGWLH